MTTDTVDLFARELQGKYGGGGQFWSRMSEAQREEWRADAREILESSGLALRASVVFTLSRALKRADTRRRLAERHAGSQDELLHLAEAARLRAEAELADRHASTAAAWVRGYNTGMSTP